MPFPSDAPFSQAMTSLGKVLSATECDFPPSIFIKVGFLKLFKKCIVFICEIDVDSRYY